MSSCLIKGGHVIDPAGRRDGVADVLVKDGLVESVGRGLKAPDKTAVIDAKGMLVVPGLIDAHSHLREPGREDEETIASGTRAAVKGGYSGVVCMANTQPPIDSASEVSLVYERAHSQGAARVYPVGAVSKGLEGRELAELGDMAAAGAVGFSDDGRPVMDSELMRRALEYSRLFDLPVVSHAEDLTLTTGGQINEGSTSTRLGLRGMPAAAEESMAARDIALARLTGGRVHIAHVSSGRTVELVRRAKADELPVTCDVTPHHLLLTEEATGDYDTNFKMNPPLRTAEDREALWEGLADGTIDCVATDHAPHAPEEKELEFDLAAFGVIGLETALALVLSESERRGGSRVRLIDALSTRPASIFSLRGGSLLKGAPGDVSVIDPKKTWTVEPGAFESMSRNTPFSGWVAQGRARDVLVGGRLVLRDGEPAWEKPGQGEPAWEKPMRAQQASGERA